LIYCPFETRKIKMSYDHNACMYCPAFRDPKVACSLNEKGTMKMIMQIDLPGKIVSLLLVTKDRAAKPPLCARNIFLPATGSICRHLILVNLPD